MSVFMEAPEPLRRLATNRSMRIRGLRHRGNERMKEGRREGKLRKPKPDRGYYP